MRHPKRLYIQGLGMSRLRLRTQLSTECVRNLEQVVRARCGKLCATTMPCAALFLRKHVLSFEINVLALSQLPCSQSYPQKTCITGLAAILPTRYIAAFVVPRGFTSLVLFSGVRFARHSSSCRLADLVVADRLDHRARAHH
jgi:hypothetical protein